MEIQQETKNYFKNPNWENRKKQLRQGRNQRMAKNVKQIMNSEANSKNQFNYSSIEAPPQLTPSKNYCDITAYETKYKDRQSGLYFYDKHILQYIHGLPKSVIDQYLALRKVSSLI